MFNINKCWIILNDTQGKKLWAKDFIINYPFFQITCIRNSNKARCFVFVFVLLPLENDYHLFIGLVSMDIFISVCESSCLPFSLCPCRRSRLMSSMCMETLHCIILEMSGHSLIQSGECLTFCCSFWKPLNQKGSKITADGDCSHEIKRCLLLGWKVMTNLESMLKSRHYFVNKGLSSQG